MPRRRHLAVSHGPQGDKSKPGITIESRPEGAGWLAWIKANWPKVVVPLLVSLAAGAGSAVLAANTVTSKVENNTSTVAALVKTVAETREDMSAIRESVRPLLHLADKIPDWTRQMGNLEGAIRVLVGKLPE